MSEGGLKKRMKGIEDSYTGSEGDAMFCGFAEYGKVLDEAKKEFPNTDSAKEEEKRLANREGIFIDYIYIYLASIDKWFKNWFGE